MVTKRQQLNLMNERICVLTGDIVRSTRLPKHDLELLMQALGDAAGEIRQWISPPGPRLERFRGDSWQLALTRPRFALRAALILRASVRMHSQYADTRIGIGVGSAELEASLASSSGSAFQHSGKMLEQIKGPDRWAFHAEDTEAQVLDLTRALFTACEGLSRRWTVKQAETVFHLLQPEEPKMAEVAERLDVRPQTIQGHFSKAGGRALLRVVHLYESSAT